MTNQYYILLHDSMREDLQAVEDYDMDDFDLTRFWSGERFEGELPSSVRIYLASGATSDYLGNPLSWPLFSKRVAQTLEKECADHVQFLPVTLYDAASRKPVRDYALLNPLGCVDAISAKNKGNVLLDRLKLDAKRIPPQRNLFRLRHQPTVLIISQRIVDILQGKGFQGLAAKRVPVV